MLSGTSLEYMLSKYTNKLKWPAVMGIKLKRFGMRNGNDIATMYADDNKDVENSAMFLTPYLDAKVLILYLTSPSTSGKSFVIAIIDANNVMNTEMKVTTGFHEKGIDNASLTA